METVREDKATYLFAVAYNWIMHSCPIWAAPEKNSLYWAKRFKNAYVHAESEREGYDLLRHDCGMSASYPSEVFDESDWVDAVRNSASRMKEEMKI